MNKSEAVLFCWKFVKNKKRILIEECFELLQIICTFGGALLLARLVSEVSSGKIVDAKGVLLLLVVYVLSLALQKTNFRYHIRNEKDIRIFAKETAMKCVLNNKKEVAYEDCSAKIMETIYSDCNSVTTLIYYCFSQLKSSICMVYSGYVIWRISPVTAIAIAGIMVIMIPILHKKTVEVAESANAFLVSNDHLFSLTRNIIGMRKYIRLSNSERFYSSKYKEQLEQTREKLVIREEVMWGIRFWMGIYEKIWLLASLLLMELWLFKDMFSLYDISLFFIYSRLFSSGIVGVVGNYSNVNSTIVSLERLQLIVDFDVHGCSDSLPFVNAGEVISLQLCNVNFSYPDRIVFDSFSVDFGKGLNIVMGENGSGKSTLLDLLAGVRTFEDGCMLLNGAIINRNDCLTNHLRLSYFAQGDTLLEGTIVENILSCRDLSAVSNSEVQHMLDVVGFTVDHGNLPAGLETSVSEMRDFSYGQKRKILLARALLKRADVYLFDEPLEGLDESSRQKVADIITQKAAEAVVIVVTHNARYFSKKTKNICL